MTEDKYRWFLSSSSAIFMFWVSIRALFSKTSFFRCSFSYRQHNKQHQINKQQQKTNSCHVTPTQLLPLGLVSSSLSHFHTLFLTQSDRPGLSSGCCATSLQPPCWGRGLGLPRLHHRGPPPEACRPEEERRTKMHQWHNLSTVHPGLPKLILIPRPLEAPRMSLWFTENISRPFRPFSHLAQDVIYLSGNLPNLQS